MKFELQNMISVTKMNCEVRSINCEFRTVKYNVWGFENLQLLEKNHLDFLKMILKMKSSTPLIMIYGEFGRFPLDTQVKTRMIKF